MALEWESGRCNQSTADHAHPFEVQHSQGELNTFSSVHFKFVDKWSCALVRHYIDSQI